MRRRSTQILSILLVLLMVLTAAGCGKKKTTTSTSTTIVTEATSTTAAAGETTTASGTTTSAAAGLGALASNCKQLSDLGQAFSQAFQGANGDVQKQAKILKEFADKTPADIRPDFETLADAFTQISGALKGVDLSSGKTPDAATLAKLMTLSQKFQNAKFQAAVKHIETWAANNCKS
jgi:ABC-type phosphate transport system substrate-binding protein